jgi:hypothetical protein
LMSSVTAGSALQMALMASIVIRYS